MTDDERFSQAAISRLTPVAPSANLRRLVAQIPIEHPHGVRSFWPFGNLWVPGFALAAAALLGLFVGSDWDSLMDAEGSTTSSSHVSEDGAVAKEAASTDRVDSEVIEDEDLDDLIMMATAAHFSPDDWDLVMTSAHNDLSEEPY